MSSATQNRHVVVVDFDDDEHYDDVIGSNLTTKVDMETQTDTMKSFRSKSTSALNATPDVPTTTTREEKPLLQSSVITLKAEDTRFAVKLSPQLSVSWRSSEPTKSSAHESHFQGGAATSVTSNSKVSSVLSSHADREVIYIDKSKIHKYGGGYVREKGHEIVQPSAAAQLTTLEQTAVKSTIPVAPPPPPIIAQRHTTAASTVTPKRNKQQPLSAAASQQQPPAVTSQAMALAAILTQSIQSNLHSLKPVGSKPPDFPASLNHRHVSQNGDVTAEETANNNNISEQRQSNRYRHHHQSQFSARRRASDDVISVAESTRTNVSSVVGKRNLADCQYVDSDAMFPPVHETVTITTQGSRSV